VVKNLPLLFQLLLISLLLLVVDLGGAVLLELEQQVEEVLEVIVQALLGIHPVAAQAQKVK
jgi:hypothetical protein